MPEPSNSNSLPQLLHTRKSAAKRLFGDPRRTASIIQLEEAGYLTRVKFGNSHSTVYIRESELQALAEKGIPRVRLARQDETRALTNSTQDD